MTDSSPAASLPTSTPRASHCGVSVLEHLDDDENRTATRGKTHANKGTVAATNTEKANIMMSSLSPPHAIAAAYAGAAATAATTLSDSSSSSTSPNRRQQQPQLGGSVSTPAYALLVGMALENDAEILSIPITSLPTTLGKDHETKDSSFVGLKEYNNDTVTEGSKSGPKLSKSMCCIYYRDGKEGGKLGYYKTKKKKSTTADGCLAGGENNGEGGHEIILKGDIDALNGMVYVPYEKNEGDEKVSLTSSTSPNDILRLPTMQETDPLPQNGFFAVECTGRKVIVGGKALKKGQHAMLSDGITIKVASHCFYFLLPKTNNTANDSRSVNVTITKSIFKSTDDKSGAVASATQTKTKRDSSAESANSYDDMFNKTPLRPAKKFKTATTPDDFTSTLESKTDKELLQMLSEATENEGWDKCSQYIGTTLATRACRAAASSSKLQKINMDFTGVTQRDVMNWINNDSETFQEYEKMMLRKIESKSFGIAMGKAIMRAGYTKTEVKSGRANRWELPSDISIPMATAVESPTTTKKSTLASVKLPTAASTGKLPQKLVTMASSKDLSKVAEEAEKTGAMDSSSKVTAATSESHNSANGVGGGGGGGGDTNKEDSSKSVLPSPEDLKVFVEVWLARPENSQVSSNLRPNAKQKDEIVKECGVDKKRLESFFYRMRKKIKEKQETEGAANNSSEISLHVASVTSALAAAPASPPGAANRDEMTQKERENIAASYGSGGSSGGCGSIQSEASAGISESS